MPIALANPEDEEVTIQTTQPRVGGMPTVTTEPSPRPTKEKEVVASIFVEGTNNGELHSRLQKAEEELKKITGYKIKIIKKNGIKLEQLLVKTDPFEVWD